jgi:hypothetical protein
VVTAPAGNEQHIDIERPTGVGLQREDSSALSPRKHLKPHCVSSNPGAHRRTMVLNTRPVRWRYWVHRYVPRRALRRSNGHLHPESAGGMKRLTSAMGIERSASRRNGKSRGRQHAILTARPLPRWSVCNTAGMKALGICPRNYSVRSLMPFFTTTTSPV